jgi:serine acetyltransferase
MPTDWETDRALYPSGRGAWISDPSLWAVATYRLGRWAQTNGGVRAKVARRLHRYLHLLMKITVGIELPLGAEIGPGFRIYHQGAITLNSGVKVGARCRMRQGVTIGVRERGGAMPVLGDDVFIGAFAQILGAVKIGDGATIGAGAVVLSDVPAGTTAVGVPAKILGAKT